CAAAGREPACRAISAAVALAAPEAPMADPARLFSLEGRTALVTGASSGLGRYFAEVLHGAGARVVLAARRVDRTEAEAARLGERASSVAMDVTEEASILGAFDRIAERHGVCDVIVNN